MTIKNLAFSLAAVTLAGCAATGSAGPGAPEPKPSASGKTLECGGASYYADSLAGNATASGEPYSPSKFTAAHKTLPFGTRLTVTREDNGKSVTVTVNDRGPFTKGRIIDLSRAAAEKIGLVRDGVADVCISKS